MLPALHRVEAGKFKASLGYTGRPYLKQNKTKQKQKCKLSEMRLFFSLKTENFI
jgi:hypothetical protein